MTEKKQEPDKPIELEDKEVETVSGGLRRQIVEDPCAGGEVTRKR